MTKKNIFPVVATIAVVGVVLGVFSMTVMRDSNVSISTMTSEQAYANLSSKMKRIGVQEVKVNPQQLDVSEFLDAKDELPDIESSYPFVVVGNGDVNIEIFSSGEKAAESGSDSFLTEMAKKFNAQHNKTSGDKTMSVSLRSIPSGTAAEYISTGKYQPECYTPSNTLFGELVKNEGVELTVEADRLVGNVAGILVSKKTGDMLRSEYGEASVSSVLNATIDGKLMMGYSNPYTSATGLNFLLEALASSGSDTIVDTAAVENFQKFQANVPLVSFTTQQMVQSADKGIVDGVVMEYQSYQNDPTLQRNYEFIPFGVRHDNPLYSIGNVSAEKKEVIAAFVSFCAQNQAEATKDGFNGLDDYAYTGKAYDGNTIAQAQSVWKEEKDSGIPIVAEFVVDTSGSMRGEPLNALKTAMINTIQYINGDKQFLRSLTAARLMFAWQSCVPTILPVRTLMSAWKLPKSVTARYSCFRERHSESTSRHIPLVRMRPKNTRRTGKAKLPAGGITGAAMAGNVGNASLFTDGGEGESWLPILIRTRLGSMNGSMTFLMLSRIVF